MKKSHLPSIAIAVSQHGKVVWEEAFGYADAERKNPGERPHAFTVLLP